METLFCEKIELFKMIDFEDKNINMILNHMLEIIFPFKRAKKEINDKLHNLTSLNYKYIINANISSIAGNKIKRKNSRDKDSANNE